MIVYPNLFVIAKLSTLFAILAYSLNVNASSKVGVTDFVVYDRFDGKYDIYALHVFAGRPGSQVLKFHICGQVYEKSTSAMGTKFKIDRCDVSKSVSFVELYYVNDGEQELFETYYPGLCDDNNVWHHIDAQDGGKVSLYMSNFKPYEINVISTVNGQVLDRFKTVIGCSYYRVFELPEEYSGITVNGVPVGGQKVN